MTVSLPPAVSRSCACTSLVPFKIGMSNRRLSRAWGRLRHALRYNPAQGFSRAVASTRSEYPCTSLGQVRQIVEPQAFSIFQLKDDVGTNVSPSCPQALQLSGLNGKRDLANPRRMDRDRRIRCSPVVDVHAHKDARPTEAKFRGHCFGS